MTGVTPAGELQRGSALLAVALSAGRREDARLVTGERRSFGLAAGRRVVNVPYPCLGSGWTTRTTTLGIALQCSPSKDRVAQFRLDELSEREQLAMAVAESRVALAWVLRHWPGLQVESRRVLGEVPPADGADILDEAIRLAATGEALRPHPVLGRLPVNPGRRAGFGASARRMYGRMPWSARRTQPPRIFYSIPVGGEGGVRNPNLPPPSRPEDEEIEIRPDERIGIPYPEWNERRRSYREAWCHVRAGRRCGNCRWRCRSTGNAPGSRRR